MKKWNYLFAALLMSVAVVFTSCSDDEETDPGPSLTIKGGAGYTSDDVTVQVGSSIKIGVVGTKSSVSGNKLTRFRFILTSNNIANTILDSTFNSDSFSWEREITFVSQVSGRLSFELTDKGGMKAEKGFNIIAQGPETIKYTGIELGSSNDNTLGSFFSTVDGNVYFVNQTTNSPTVQALIDFLFVKNPPALPSIGNIIASPDDEAAESVPVFKLNLWTTRNQTRFNTSNITAAEFDAIGANYVFPSFDLLQQTKRTNGLSVGNVVVFRTKSNKIGLIKVVDLYTKGDKMKIDVIMEK
ncbi:hypothetical protein SDC9_31707 [bioreactor metagenome]|jgi:ribosomal protein L27|uniref:Uncharacterized protein n=1 Tax=bioreactor metagenome TaxID=1076179 RepID=A0A644V3A3_9ZZZZ|nr:hypothetical protein [Lentimicrobium sp.]MEA5111403.1 hypothetical protein [Lentimicrobium sp.]